MADHQTEEQQVEALKAFWHNNGNAIIAGLFIGFGSFIGYGNYQEHKLESEINTSEAYQNVLELADKDDEAYREAGEKFINENADSSYTALTAFALAKDAAEHQDWQQAAKYLTTAIEKSSDNSLKAIATVRLARVQVQLEQYEQAIATVSQALPESFKASVEEIKGDAYLKQEQLELARTAYQAAIEASGQNVAPALQMKLDDLAQNIVLAK
ncbi:membrane protein [Thalassotalea insulae]|uniref:Ancillary SecYEG translocon subunit n=1 Tax=Thalassotalea insulae TaxID=2056778 RepID=A0ABQ6GTX6_9GAMM|nr:tetratricopeptide repeat protein [Thalassotalea insulae]GLX79395.1 membrane protein [Thalassotalea insulae]